MSAARAQVGPASRGADPGAHGPGPLGQSHGRRPSGIIKNGRSARALER
jgi:hypothetical protein